MENHDENNETEKLSLKETIISWLWFIYFAGFIIQTVYGYFFHPILQYKGLAFNIGKGLVWFTVFPIFKELLGLMIILALVYLAYAKK